VNVRVVAAYAVMCVIWGTTWLAIKVALTGCSPLGGVGARFLIAGAVLYVGSVVFPRPKAEAPPLKLIVMLAVTMVGGNYCLTYLAETHLASGLVAVLFGTMPFFIFGLGAVMLREPVSARAVAGALAALGGVITISLTGEGGALVYILAAVLASALSALGTVYLKRYAHCDPLRTFAPAMLLSGTVVSIAAAFTSPVDFSRALAWPPILATLYLAIFGSSITFYLNHWLLRRLTAWMVGLQALIIPVIAVIVGALFANEAFGARELIGAALVIAGVWIALSGVPVVVDVDGGGEDLVGGADRDGVRLVGGLRGGHLDDFRGEIDV
jgi:drug/metabolite transporter (DMT)-like permease